MSCILIVEDDQATREALSALLHEEGYPVSSAVNGQDALNQLRAGLSPCLILLDLMMPVMSGWEFRDHVAKDPTLAQIPFVLLSAHEADGSAIYKEAAALLPKPIEFDDLMTTVVRVCGTPKTPGTPGAA